MNKASKVVIAVVTATGIVVASGAALARRDGGGMERMVERVSSRLELDQYQQEALSTLASEMTETRQLMRGDTDLREEFGALISAETFDQVAALTMIEQRTAALQANAPELVAAAAGFLDGLNAEQKADIEQFLDRHDGGHGKGGHGGHHGRMGGGDNRQGDDDGA